MDRTAKPHRVHQYFYNKFHNVDKCPNHWWSADKSAFPAPNSVHVTREQEEKMMETQPPPTQSFCKDALMVLWVLDLVVSMSNADNRIVQANDEQQHCV
jgi:hypothetical protein